MDEYILTAERIAAYGRQLEAEERSPGTVEKYLRDARPFARWTNGESVTKERAVEWKEYLLSQSYAPATINAMLAAVNGLFCFLGWDECRVKFLKIQRRLFRDAGRELTRPEYDCLLETARARGQARLALLMESICATGIRVSEVKYLTIEAAQAGKAEISLKGKVRTILIPGKLSRKLLKYAKKHKIGLRRDFSHPRRQVSFQKADLGGDEGNLQGSGGDPLQGVPPQPAAFVCPDLLQSLP